MTDVHVADSCTFRRSARTSALKRRDDGPMTLRDAPR